MIPWNCREPKPPYRDHLMSRWFRIACLLPPLALCYLMRVIIAAITTTLAGRFKGLVSALVEASTAWLKFQDVIIVWIHDARPGRPTQQPITEYPDIEDKA